jgi:hypothetical protein
MFQGRLSPGLQSLIIETAGEPLYADESNFIMDAGVTVQYRNTGLTENPTYLLRVPRFMVVIAKNSQHRNRDVAQELRQRGSFFRLPIICQISAQQENISVGVGICEEGPKNVFGGFWAMEVAYCG